MKTPFVNRVFLFNEKKTRCVFQLLCLLVFSCSLCLLSCKTSEKMEKKNDAELSSGFKPAFPVSSFTGLFLKEFMECAPPSSLKDQSRGYKNLIKKYRLLRLEDGGYALSGFLKTNERFDSKKLTDKGIRISMQAGDLLTVTIPLTQIFYFFSQTGIDYFEASLPVNPLLSNHY